ncbi:MAG: PEP-CTERM sorting domain-containing protein [Comamonadaceae bacterium]|nr:PEP-CTERM sorting domain-containing protein [Comamonadaceae bacterium]
MSPFTFNFAAISSQSTISFRDSSLGTIEADGLLDRVSVSAVSSVPEPETYAMMLAGLGLIGTIARRRRAKQA